MRPFVVVLCGLLLLASGCTAGGTRTPAGTPTGSGILPWVGPDALVMFSRIRHLEDGSITVISDLLIHGGGKVEATVRLERPGVNNRLMVERWNVELLISASEVDRILDLIEEAGLDELPRVDVEPGCWTTYTISWLRPGETIATGTGVSFCQENVPPRAVPLLEALNLLSDEAVRRAIGGGR